MHILNSGSTYRFYNDLNIISLLPTKNYLFNYDDFGNCWLEDLEDFKYPSKIYDVSDNLRSMIKVAFDSKSRNLGVLLTGNKGQGKSLTAKLICKDINLPTIIINKQIPNYVDFVAFLNSIKQDYILFVDEFEKLFKTTNDKETDYKTQEVFLSFMDGVLTNESKILFLLTTNESVNTYFINRPSRIKFLQEYEELSEELFHMITDDLLVNKSFKQDLEESVSLLNMNIDLLISILEDVNLFNKPFSEFATMYNYKNEMYRYELYYVDNGVEKLNKIFQSKTKIKHNQTQIAGWEVMKLKKFSKDEIVFQTTRWDDDPNDSDRDIKVVFDVKLVPIKKGFESLELVF